MPNKAESKGESKKNSKGFSHPDYDAAVLDCFLEMCFAVVVKSRKEVRRYFEEVGTDIEGEDVLAAAEVFPVGDGRYLIVEG